MVTLRSADLDSRKSNSTRAARSGLLPYRQTCDFKYAISCEGTIYCYVRVNIRIREVRFKYGPSREGAAQTKQVHQARQARPGHWRRQVGPRCGRSWKVRPVRRLGVGRRDRAHTARKEGTIQQWEVESASIELRGRCVAIVDHSGTMKRSVPRISKLFCEAKGWCMSRHSQN